MENISRRGFVSHLLRGAGATLALSALPRFAAAHEHAAAQMKSEKRKLEFFTVAKPLTWMHSVRRSFHPVIRAGRTGSGLALLH